MLVRYFRLNGVFMKFLVMFFLLISGVAESSQNGVISGYGVVKRVVDGDTYIIQPNESSVMKTLRDNAPTKALKKLSGNTVTIRLASVDTPESNHPDKSRNSMKGKIVKAAVKRALNNKEVYFKCFDFGYYGRAICNVELVLSNSQQDVGYWLMKSKFSTYIRKYGDNPFNHEAYIKVAGENK
jgi:endonuclease YncB( thermonuclease family)